MLRQQFVCDFVSAACLFLLCAGSCAMKSLMVLFAPTTRRRGGFFVEGSAPSILLNAFGHIGRVGGGLAGGVILSSHGGTTRFSMEKVSRRRPNNTSFKCNGIFSF
ncbi:hypothetical protein MES4922_360140 [Mesorhizobium ventifaucium]|uniref:Secreted protein n=1 Tax=Mesorhizobium ventifaucium TaxID=666020 RepID=A0ABN8K2N2_9HYPH|nr:hypothetical protein MES4922_360140 [Mesorhizobium ventifaucium]